MPHDSPTAVSCPSLNLCVAGSFAGAIFTSTDPTGGAGAWSSTRVGAPPVCGDRSCVSDSIEAVSCASEKLCAATDGENLWVSTSPGTPSASWTKSALPKSRPSQYSRVLACPAVNLCVSAIDEELDATSDPSNPSPTWVVTHLPSVTGAGDFGSRTPGVVSAVSCPSTQLCVAVDDVAGYAFAGDPTEPNSWTATKIDTPLVDPLVRGPGALTGVSCWLSGLCVAVDAAGKMIVGRVSG